MILEEDVSPLASGLERVDRLLSQQGSIGGSRAHADFVPGEDRTYQSVFKRADAALYNDKRESYRTHPDTRRP